VQLAIDVDSRQSLLGKRPTDEQLGGAGGETPSPVIGDNPVAKARRGRLPIKPEQPDHPDWGVIVARHDRQYDRVPGVSVGVLASDPRPCAHRIKCTRDRGEATDVRISAGWAQGLDIGEFPPPK